MVRFLVAFSMVVLLSTTAMAQKRVALIIGNAAYRHASTLANPNNDATDIGAALKSLGFEIVEGIDLDKAGMERTLREFSRRLEGAEVGLFFYAGHGLQVKGTNYLVAIDAKLEAERDLDFEAMKVDTVLAHMEREARTNIVFLDACRNNTLARNLARTMGTRSVGENSGLAPVASGLGTFIAFATEPGAVASDGAQRNSPFATALKKQLPVAGLSLGDMMIEVRREVVDVTKGTQVPWDHSALRSQFYFKAPPPAPQPSEASREWTRVDKSSATALEDFVRKFGTSPEADYARWRIDSLRSQLAGQQVPNLTFSRTEPIQPETTTATKFVVQVSSQRSRAEAVSSLVAIEAKYTALLANKQMGIQEGRIREGVWYRGVFGPPMSRDEANRLCDQLKSAGGHCIVAAEASFSVVGASELLAPKYGSLGSTSPAPAAVCDGGNGILTTVDMEKRCLKPRETFRDCAECPEMVMVRAGDFKMGAAPEELAALLKLYNNERMAELSPQHPVKIANAFAVGKFEVTFAEWDACVAAGGCTFRPYDGAEDLKEKWGRGQRPVINVSWQHVTGEYLPWLSRHSKKTYRLLTEAEWEYAARAGATAIIPITITKKLANFDTAKSVPVGSYPANAFGLHDMFGNVAEWVEDCWNWTYDGAPANGSAWLSGDCSSRVMRGGSISHQRFELNAVARTQYNGRYSTVGFRVARTLD